ncbi:hypothetical protein [Maricaulis sp.]|uniref:hypothetical protein n=1 Tax=Maricaulis sp. TaxID=1486257 RepID=UPI003A8F175E
MNEVEQFQRTKRYLGFFTGVLLLNEFVGLKDTDAPGAFGVALKSNEMLDVVLSAVVFFYMLRMLNFWTLQDESYRSRRQHQLDDFGHFFVAVLAISYTAYDRFSSQISGFFSLPFVIPVAGVIATLLAFFAALRIRQAGASSQHARVYKIREAILNGDWYLLYANSGTGELTQGRNYKKIRFGHLGDIVEGKNKNEDAWRLEGEFLEILNSAGVLFSRFRYLDRYDRFVATDDADVKALPRQRIVRDVEAWLEAGRP